MNIRKPITAHLNMRWMFLPFIWFSLKEEKTLLYLASCPLHLATCPLYLASFLLYLASCLLSLTSCLLSVVPCLLPNLGQAQVGIFKELRDKTRPEDLGFIIMLKEVIIKIKPYVKSMNKPPIPSLTDPV